MCITRQDGAADRITLSAAEAARLLSVSERHFWSLHDQALVPAPIRLGRRTVWSRSELERWIGTGGPTRERWNQIKKERHND